MIGLENLVHAGENFVCARIICDLVEIPQ